MSGPIGAFFGSQRQRGGVHDNPNAGEFMKNTQALRVVNGLGAQKRGNCRGGELDDSKDESTEVQTLGAVQRRYDNIM